MFNKDFYKLENDEKRWLIFILAIGFILRIYYLLEVHSTPFYQNLFSDSKIYFDWAKDIAMNNNWVGDGPFFMAPVYPYFMSLFIKVFGDVTIVIKIVQVFISTFTVFVVYKTGKEFNTKQTGYIAALIASVYSVFIFYSSAILSETLQAFVFAILVYELLKERKTDAKISWFYVGLYFGAATLFRANVLLFLPVLAIYLFVKSKKTNTKLADAAVSFGLFLIGTILFIMPVTLHNYSASGEFIPLTANGGINFYIGNNDRSPGVFIAPEEFNLSQDMAGKKYAERQQNRRMNYTDASGYWYDRAKAYILNKPGDFTSLLVTKLFLFFHPDEFPQATMMDPGYFADNYSDLLKLPLPAFGFVSFFAVIGIILLLRSNKDKMSLYFFLAYLFATILFFVNGRFRIAITPLMILFAAYAIIRLTDAVKNSKFSDFKIPAGVAVVFVLILTFFINVPKFNEYDAYLHLGDIEYNKANLDKAVEYYNRATFFKDVATPYMNMGNALARKKDYRTAIASYNKALDREPENPLTYFNLGFAYTQMGQMDKAYEAYNKTLELDPFNENAIRNIGILFYVQESYEDALVYFERYLELSTNQDIKRNVVMDIENIKRKLQNNDKEQK